MRSDSSKIVLRRYFDREAGRYDAIYTNDKPLGQRIVDSLFRSVILKRYDLILRRCAEVKGLVVLDIGCGSGRFSVEMARRGASVVGVDISKEMLALARMRARDAEVEGCTFIRGDFSELNFKGKFDICLSIGVLDYLYDPLPFLEKIVRLTGSKFIASFPKRMSVRALSRKVRLTMRGCPIRFYSRGEIRRFFDELGGMGNLEIVPLGRDYISFYDLGQQNRGYRGE